MEDEYSGLDETTILAEVGKALASFTGIESAIARLFKEFSGSDDFIKSDIIMASIVSFDARLSVCVNLEKDDPLPHPFHEIWSRLASRSQKLLKKRNALAHFQIAVMPNGNYAISPYYSMGRNWIDKGPLRTLSLEQVIDRRAEFAQHRDALHWLLSKVQESKGRLPASPVSANELIRWLQDELSQNPVEQ